MHTMTLIRLVSLSTLKTKILSTRTLSMQRGGHRATLWPNHSDIMTKTSSQIQESIFHRNMREKALTVNLTLTKMKRSSLTTCMKWENWSVKVTDMAWINSVFSREKGKSKKRTVRYTNRSQRLKMLKKIAKRRKVMVLFRLRKLSRVHKIITILSSI